MGSDARIDQLEGRSPEAESCLSWLGSHKDRCPKHDLFMLEYYIVNVQHYEIIVYQR